MSLYAKRNQVGTPIKTVLRAMMAKIEASIKNKLRTIISSPSKNPKIVAGIRKGPESGMIALMTGLTTLSRRLAKKKFANTSPVAIEVSNAMTGHSIKANIEPNTFPAVVSAVAILHATMHDRPKK